MPIEIGRMGSVWLRKAVGSRSYKSGKSGWVWRSIDTYHGAGSMTLPSWLIVYMTAFMTTLKQLLSVSLLYRQGQ